MENLAARLHYMEEAKEDVRADIAVMRRAAEKADTEVTKAEIEKKKQVGVNIKGEILLSCPHTFLIEVLERSY